MTLPSARLAVVDGCIGIGCPYCGAAIPRGSVRFHPAFDPGDGVPDARDVSWESRCPRCGGDFAIPGGRTPSRDTVSAVVGTDHDRELLLRVMASLESLELAVADLRADRPRLPRDPPWSGRDGA